MAPFPSTRLCTCLLFCLSALSHGETLSVPLSGRIAYARILPHSRRGAHADPSENLVTMAQSGRYG
jgi:hypothetical protein